MISACRPHNPWQCSNLREVASPLRGLAQPGLDVFCKPHSFLKFLLGRHWLVWITPRFVPHQGVLYFHQVFSVVLEEHGFHICSILHFREAWSEVQLQADDVVPFVWTWDGRHHEQVPEEFPIFAAIALEKENMRHGSQALQVCCLAVPTCLLTYISADFTIRYALEQEATVLSHYLFTCVTRKIQESLRYTNERCVLDARESDTDTEWKAECSRIQIVNGLGKDFTDVCVIMGGILLEHVIAGACNCFLFWTLCNIIHRVVNVAQIVLADSLSLAAIHPGCLVSCTFNWCFCIVSTARPGIANPKILGRWGCPNHLGF